MLSCTRKLFFHPKSSAFPPEYIHLRQKRNAGKGGSWERLPLSGCTELIHIHAGSKTCFSLCFWTYVFVPERRAWRFSVFHKTWTASDTKEEFYAFRSQEPWWQPPFRTALLSTFQLGSNLTIGSSSTKVQHWGMISIPMLCFPVSVAGWPDLYPSHRAGNIQRSAGRVFAGVGFHDETDDRWCQNHHQRASSSLHLKLPNLEADGIFPLFLHFHPR